MSSTGRIYWNELNTWDARKAMAYYGPIMGWTFEEVATAGTDQQRPYYIAKSNGERVAGIFTMVRPMFEGVPEHWFTYLAVADIGVALSQSDALGGRTMRPPFEIPGFGVLAIVADANGGVMGLIQPA